MSGGLFVEVKSYVKKRELRGTEKSGHTVIKKGKKRISSAAGAKKGQ